MLQVLVMQTWVEDREPWLVKTLNSILIENFSSMKIILVPTHLRRQLPFQFPPKFGPQGPPRWPRKRSIFKFSVTSGKLILILIKNWTKTLLTKKVLLQSPWWPPMKTVTSMLTMSPSSKGLENHHWDLLVQLSAMKKREKRENHLRSGIPWHTTLFTEVHTDFGKPLGNKISYSANNVNAK